MTIVRRPYAYTKVDKEDPEEKIHRKAQFLIYKVLELADSQRRPSFLRIRLSKLKIKIGKKLKRLRKSVLLSIHKARISFYKQVISLLKTWKLLFGCRENIPSLPPLLA